ncbi:uncharacterized protein [Nicotiana sylvestris]|uniref:uncharacterized protein n=1 Tax=Nicotiana sylvestris TaxID=4096 RepID=UPI00388CEBB2
MGSERVILEEIGSDEYNKIQSCTTAKEIWDTLQVAHEGTPQVKRSRGTLLYSQYENFTMKEGETIQEMYTRFTTITNKLKSLRRINLEEDKVEKILTRVLLVTWESKINAIHESKNIATLKLDELIGNLTAYELRRQTIKMDAPKKERSLALRIAEGADLEDDVMAMITRDLKEYLMRGNGSSRGTTFNKPRALEKQTNKGCYKCVKTDHMIKNYPQWGIKWKKERAERRNMKKEQVQSKRNKGSTKAMVAAWGEISDEDEAGDEQTLMAIRESDDEQEVSVIHLKDKIKFLSKERLSELLLDFINESEVLELDICVSELRSENLKQKLGIDKKKADHTHITLEENLGKLKDELYKKDEQIRVLKEDLGKVQVKGSSQIWYMDNGCSKYMTGSKNQFLSLEDLK